MIHFFHVVHLLIQITTSLLSRLAEGYSTERSTAVAVKTPISKCVVKPIALAMSSVKSSLLIRKKKNKMIHGELVVDNFAGGGGASTGIELATGYSVDIAINHDPEAIKMHKANHPYTKHYCEDVWQVDPVAACKGHPVGLAWFSPDCKHFSKAKGGKPKDKFIRGLAWVACRWAGLVRPRVIMLENVEEFKTW